jgi:energy-coupling factor transporter ATP-binding protein EcfA2
LTLIAGDVRHVYARGEPDEVLALDLKALRVEDGEFVVIAGNSGSGKSTLLRCLAGLLRPTSGEVAIDGIDVRKCRGLIGLAVQFPERALFGKTLYDDVAFGLRNRGLGEDNVRRGVLGTIGLVGLDERLLICPPRSMSQGQKRLASLAGAIAQGPKYLFLDEPTAGLDPVGRRKVIEALARLNRDGMAIVAASHNMAHFSGTLGRLVILESGKIKFDGKPDELVSLEGLEALGLALPPSLVCARDFMRRGIAVEWDAGPEKIAELLRRAHEGRV